MGWHRDLKVNYDELNGIYNTVRSYIDALTDLQTATTKFVSVINEQEGDSFVELDKECKDIVEVNNTDLINVLTQVSDNIGGYMSDMQAIIAPENSAAICRVDRNDIWANIFQIENIVCDISGNLFVPSYSYADEYVDPDSEHADEVRARNAERRRRRQNNYNKLNGFSSTVQNVVFQEFRDEWNAINSVHENYVKEYENTDDNYASKMKSIYYSIASFLDLVEDTWDNIKDFARGAGKGVIGFCKGLKAPLEIIIGLSPLIPLPMGIKAALLEDGVSEIYFGFKGFIDDPEGSIEGMLQGASDTADEEGLAFTAGYLGEKIVEVVIIKKAGEKLSGAEFADDLAGTETVEGVTRLYSKETLSMLENTENFTDSAIEHIFQGQIKKKSATGYHYECIEGTAGQVIEGTASIPNEFGVYQAKVEVGGVLKVGNGGASTFFPIDMSPQEVIDTINEAYISKAYVSGNKYVGQAMNGIVVEMYLDKSGKIISAFPKF